MALDFVKLLLVFLVIVICIAMKRRLGVSMFIATLFAVMVYRIPLVQVIQICGKSLIEKETLLVIATFLLVTFLQRIMEKKNLLEQAEDALQKLSGSKRMVCMIAPVIIGFLPSMGAVNICGVIVDNATGEDMTKEEKTFVTSYYRHISESFSPTYNSILLALSLTSLTAGRFVLITLPMVAVLMILGYFFYLRRMGGSYAVGVVDKKEELKKLFYCFWPLLGTILLVIALNQPAVKILPVIILACIVVYKLKPMEVWEYAKTSVEMRIIINTIILMIFKNLLNYTGVIAKFPDLFAHTSLPAFLSYGLIVFLGTLVSGANAMIVLILPIAFQAIPGAGVALLMYLMCVSYAAMQVSPTHICLDVVVEHFGISFGALVKKTLPVIASFLVILTGYYLILTMVGIG